MNERLAINLCVIQPGGSVPMQGLGLLDAAVYFRHQFQRLGAQVTLSKNRLMRDAVNLVFGAHLGFDAALKRDHICMFVNLEPLTGPSARPSLAYLELLRHSLVIDHDPANVASYSAWPEDVPLVSFGHAPYVSKARIEPAALASRPIDLLFIGTLNERRARLIARIEAMGRKVTTLSTPLYGPERARLVAQARGVLVCHAAPGQRLDPVQAFQVLSAGTPVVAERSVGTSPDEALDLCSLWFEELQLERFFTDEYGSSLYFDVASRALDVFSHADPIDAYADCLAFAVGVHKVERTRRQGNPRAVRRLHLGAGCDYRPGWLNVDALSHSAPDAVLDLSQPQRWPITVASPSAGSVSLCEESLDEVHAADKVVQAHDLRTLMSNCLTLLKTGGRMTVTVPHERAPSAWQDPANVRAMNEQSWRSWTDRFWTQDWFTHRFDRTGFTYLDHRRLPCERDAAWFMQVELTKVETTLVERTQARHQRADFGPLYMEEPTAEQAPMPQATAPTDRVAVEGATLHAS